MQFSGRLESTAQSSMQDPYTTRGALFGRVFYDVANQVFRAHNGTAWKLLMTNPMTAVGDVIYGGTAGAETRLAIGTAGQHFQVNAGATAPSWTNTFTVAKVITAATPQLRIGSSDTNSADKTGFLVGTHYTSSTEEPVGLIGLSVNSTENIVRIGGGNSSTNAATEINFWTASTSTTTTGTSRANITATSGLQFQGTTTNNNAATGYVGEYMSNNRSSNLNVASAGPGVFFSVDTGNSSVNDGNETGVVLTAGDWDISGNVYFDFNSVTTATTAQAFIGTAKGNASTGRDLSQNWVKIHGSFASGATAGVVLPVWRVSLSAMTTYYLKAEVGAAALATMNVRGTIRARRVR